MSKWRTLDVRMMSPLCFNILMCFAVLHFHCWLVVLVFLSASRLSMGWVNLVFAGWPLTLIFELHFGMFMYVPLHCFELRFGASLAVLLHELAANNAEGEDVGLHPIALESRHLRAAVRPGPPIFHQPVHRDWCRVAKVENLHATTRHKPQQNNVTQQHHSTHPTFCENAAPLNFLWWKEMHFKNHHFWHPCYFSGI